MFNNLMNRISDIAKPKSKPKFKFSEATERLEEFIDDMDDLVAVLEQIGTIPESIAHDSTEEKLFAKASDIVLSRAFREIGLKSTIIMKRSNSADVQAESKFHGYTLVADAKAFRMSRTAKNQKDFKVVALSGWRKDADYAVLCAPYFHYPKSSSQIYAQSIEENVCLLGWEHLIFMLKNEIKESPEVDFSALWNYGGQLSRKVVVAQKKDCFLDGYNQVFLSTIGRTRKEYGKELSRQIPIIRKRGLSEEKFLKDKKEGIRGYSREQAIEELIRAENIDGKIQQIKKYIEGLGDA